MPTLTYLSQNPSVVAAETNVHQAAAAQSKLMSQKSPKQTTELEFSRSIMMQPLQSPKVESADANSSNQKHHSGSKRKKYRIQQRVNKGQQKQSF